MLKIKKRNKGKTRQQTQSAFNIGFRHGRKSNTPHKRMGSAGLAGFHMGRLTRPTRSQQRSLWGLSADAVAKTTGWGRKEGLYMWKRMYHDDLLEWYPEEYGPLAS